ncbi:MAG: hypothetical protein Q8Q09_16415 [Deltaproteobacteria bacterium]|nr:hypothetical protein [Deltaproteobacteria bacterium]
MNSKLSRVLRIATATWVAGLCAQVVGCAENLASVEIRQFQQPIADPMNPTACVVNADQNSLKLFTSVLDLSLRDSYTAFPLIQNNLYSSRSVESNRPDQRAILPQFVDVELATLDGTTLLSLPDPAGGAAMLNRYRIPLRTDLINAGSSSGAGFGVVEMPVIPSNVGAALRARLGCDDTANLCARRSLTINVTLRPTYRTVGGLTISGARDSTWTNAAPYSFPLTVCCGCLVEFPGSGVDSACRSTAMTAEAAVLGYCLVGQDYPISCLRCNGNPACQPRTCAAP